MKGVEQKQKQRGQNITLELNLSRNMYYVTRDNEVFIKHDKSQPGKFFGAVFFGCFC